VSIDWTRWRRKRDGEPMAPIMVIHYLTRGDMIELLCSSEFETGTRLPVRAIMAELRMALRVGGTLEPTETWVENCVTAAEAEARRKWAEEQVAKL
jgi:hypothetical protein